MRPTKRSKATKDVTVPLDLVEETPRRKLVGLVTLRHNAASMIQDLKWRQEDITNQIIDILLKEKAFDYLQVNWRRLTHHTWDKESSHDPGCTENPLTCDCF